MKILRDVDVFRPTFIEQPVPRRHLDAMAGFAAALDTPILADESCFDAVDPMELVRRQAADAISVKLTKCGGLFKAHALMVIADTAGLPGYGGTFGKAASRSPPAPQLIAATPGISLSCEFYMPHHVLTEDVLEARIANCEGHVEVPDGPGLRITVSEASLRGNAKILAEA